MTAKQHETYTIAIMSATIYAIRSENNFRRARLSTLRIQSVDEAIKLWNYVEDNCDDEESA